MKGVHLCVCVVGREKREDFESLQNLFGGVLIAVLSHPCSLSPNPFDVLPSLVNAIAMLRGVGL